MRPRRSEASTIWSTIYANRSNQDGLHLPDQIERCKMGTEHRLRQFGAFRLKSGNLRSRGFPALETSLFVDREDDGMGVRVHVEADNVLEFLR
jgi:hypothetical protein